MGLKEDLEIAFQDTIDNRLESNDLATAITAAYKDACKSGSDSIGNSYGGQLFPLVETAIKTAFDLCFALGKAGTPASLDLNLVSASLVACWTPALLKLPATHPGFSSVISGNVTVSIPVPVPPIPDPDPENPTTEEIVNAFFNMFTLHAKSIQFLYSGLALAGSPPPPITIPATIFNIN